MIRQLHILLLKLFNVTIVPFVRSFFGVPLPSVTRKVIQLKRDVPIITKIEYDAVPRPNYGYGVLQAALQAKALGIDRISAIEFGVAGGNGLVELERVAEAIAAETGVGVDVYGFDMGDTGMPPPKDYRDLPYLWQPGFFRMDEEKLRSRLKQAKLILGNVEETVQSFVEKHQPARIGFIAFDLDYYSSTMAAFKLFEEEHEFFLPRVFCYFDDCIGDDWELHCDYVGVLLAIREYNELNEGRKIARINGLEMKRIQPRKWNSLMYVHHDFAHPLYISFVYPQEDWQEHLKESS